ncbi:MAG TPA: glycine oxidase ThiO [Candidatus Polarisedimenticolia bacterium]|jgi:glycine oxidase|nr:glycine oxidase ThiO [Candidatus Polarisedimenticolia bacterium]
MRSQSSDDVIVVGGGIIGLSIAREAARSRLRVRLFEKGEIGREASAAAAGLLGPQIGLAGGDPLQALGLASRDLYPGFARSIAAESGLDPCLLERGTVLLPRDAGEIEAIDRQAAFQHSIGLPAERVSGEALRRLEPSLHPGLTEGLYLPRDWSVDNVLLVQGLGRAAARAGARLVERTRIDRLLVEGGRVAGVGAGGETFHAGTVVIAAGAWTQEIGGDGVPPLASHPVRGQIVCLGPSAAPARPLYATACYLVPRQDGRILVGSTMERVGFERRVTAAGVTTLTAAAIALVPALREAPFHSAWAGLRPACEDDLPAIGRGGAPGLIYACGHLRNGILLAPITALVVGRILRGEDPGFDLARFDPRRFTAAVGGQEAG